MGSTELYTRLKLVIDISRACVKKVLNTCICLLGTCWYRQYETLRVYTNTSPQHEPIYILIECRL